jgi:hypothetical protein
MRISKTKGLNPRAPLLKQAFVFESTMGPLLSHLRANNKMEISTLRDVARLTATAVYQHIRGRIKNLPTGTPKEVCIRHNDSIAYLKTKFAKTINKISKHNFGYNL